MFKFVRIITVSDVMSYYRRRTEISASIEIVISPLILSFYSPNGYFNYLLPN